MASGEYPGSTWYGASSNNYTQANRPSSNPVDKIIIHVTQGSWSGAINWFLDPNAEVSVHYTVRSSDGFIGQSVQEKDIAWHAGNWSYNQTSIGIEHEGYVSDPNWFTETMYISSAQLTAYLCKKYGISIDRTHIIGHHEVPDPYDPGQYGGVNNHTDPGDYWDWTKYMDYVEYYAGTVEDATAPTVSSKSPSSGQTGVRRATNVTATFSEEMDQTTLTGSTVNLYQKYWYRVRKKRNGRIRRVWTYTAVSVSIDPRASLRA